MAVSSWDEGFEKRLRDACVRMKRRSDDGEWSSESVYWRDLQLALDELDRLRSELKELKSK